MRITVNRTKLSEALTELAPLSSKNKVLPVYNNVKFATKGNRIRLQATDTKTAIRKYIEADCIDEEGMFLVDCVSLATFVNKTKGDMLTLRLNNGTLTVEHDKGKAEFQTDNSADCFVDPEQDGEATEISLSATIVARLIAVARNFVGNDDLRPTMKAIRAIIKDGNLTVCATDTRKMFMDVINIDSDTPDAQWYIEPDIFSAIIAACKNQDSVTIKVTKDNVSYRIGSTTIFSQQTIGNYPDFNRVIPQNNNIEAVCDKADIVDAIQRAMLFAESTGLIKVSVSGLSMNIQGDNLTKLSKATETIPCVANADILFGVSAPILLECVKACGADKVSLELTTASKPIIIKDNNNNNRVILCMPMAILNE